MNKMKSTVIAFAILIPLIVGPGSAFSAALYVSATAAPGGNGTLKAPFNSLAAVEAASKPGDTIFVLASPITVAPLDGGIALKPHQRLIGFPRSTHDDWMPRITNSSAARNSGDAVTLAIDNEVRGLVIENAYRGGMYGINVDQATIKDNEIIGGNVSCVPGFLIYFPVGFPVVLTNGWAAIMLDADAGKTSLVVDNNYIHDGYCNDGIDIRTSGDAQVKAEVSGNDITYLPQGAGLNSVLAIGMQTRDTAELIVNSDRNSQTYIGSTGADCEGLFSNQTGGSLVWNIHRNTFAHGIGGASCNGGEFFIGQGAATADIKISNSTFEDNPGDMLETNNLGTGSVLNLTIEDVDVKHTTRTPALPTEPIIPPLGFITGWGFCMSQFSTGPQASTNFRMINSHFSDCAADGIFAFFADLSAILPLPGGIGVLSSIDIENSSISNVNDSALHWVNYGDLEKLRIKVQNSSFTDARGLALIAIDQYPGAVTMDAKIDLGSGALGSLGRNCIIGGPGLAAETTGYDVDLENNWWGSPAGPAASSLSATNGFLDVTPVLRKAPPACRPFEQCPDSKGNEVD